MKAARERPTRSRSRSTCAMSSGDRRMAVEEARSWWLGFWEKGPFMGWSVLRQPTAAVPELVC